MPTQSAAPHAMRDAAERPAILVVDDEPRNRALVSAYLSPTYAVIEAESGPAALEILARGERVDLVLLDVMMPELSGFETCRAIKAGVRDGFLPVVLLTSLADQEDRNTGLAVGADEFLSKPVNRTELLLRLRALLEIRRQEALIRRQLADLRQFQALKDDLFALVLHDIRNPLAGIDGYIELLARRLAPDDAKVKRAIESIAASARDLREILDGVLEVKLLESGELVLKREPVAIGPLVAEAIVALEGAAEKKRVRFRLELDPDLVLPLDRRLTRRVVENLVSNAVKYSPPDEEVLARAAAAPGGAVAIEVADRGPGIPDAMKAGVFAKFVTVESGTGLARRGYGLGLHLVKLAAEAHGGDVTVSDREGGGSVFRVVLRDGQRP